MANEEHVALLRQGVNVWNAWREKEPRIRPDLSEANLNGADLRGADLSEANLYKADLSGADLSYADLTLTNLERLTKPSLDEAPSDEGRGEGEGETDSGPSLAADRQAPEPPERGERAFCHPAMPCPARPRRTRRALWARIGFG